MNTGLASVSVCSIVCAQSSDSKAMNPFSDNMKISPSRDFRGLLLPLGG